MHVVALPVTDTAAESEAARGDLLKLVAMVRQRVSMTTAATLHTPDRSADVTSSRAHVTGEKTATLCVVFSVAAAHISGRSCACARVRLHEVLCVTVQSRPMYVYV